MHRDQSRIARCKHYRIQVRQPSFPFTFLLQRIEIELFDF